MMDDWDSVPKVNKEKARSQWFGEDVEEEVKDSWEQDVEVDPKRALKNKLQKDEIRRTHRKTDIEETQEVKVETNDSGVDVALAEERYTIETAGVEWIASSTDYDKFKHDILTKLDDCEKNVHFVKFVENLVSGLCVHMSSSDTKRIHNILGNMHLEKYKADKTNKPKNKCKQKAKLRIDNEIDIRNLEYSKDFFDY